MKKRKLKLSFKKIRNIWSKKGLKSKIKAIFLVFFGFICLILLSIVMTLKSFSTNFINKNIKVEKKGIEGFSKKEQKEIVKDESIFSKDNTTIITDKDNQSDNLTNSSNSSSSISDEGNNEINSQTEQLNQSQLDQIQEPIGNTIELEVLNYINSLRTSLGLSILLWDNSIYSYAKIRAEEIISLYSHIRPNGQTSLTSAPTSIHAENLAYGQNSAAEIFNDWKNSPTHYENFINSSYSKCAISVVQNSENVLYWVYLVY